MKINKKELLKYKDLLLGTCISLDQFVENQELKIEMDDLEDLLLDVDIEQCKICGWWFESYELIDYKDEDNYGYCEDCR